MRILIMCLSLVGACKGGDATPQLQPAPQPGPPPSSDPPAPAEPTPAVAASAEGGDRYEKPVIRIERDGAKVKARIVLRRRAGASVPRGDVPYTAEPWTLATTERVSAVQEADILGTGLAMDLDGDGKTTSALPVDCQNGVLEVGDARLAPLGSATFQRHDYSDDAVRRIGARGAYGFLYGPCDQDMVFVGVSPADEPLTIERVAGPALQVLLIEEVPDPRTPTTAGISAIRGAAPGASPRRHRSRTHEPSFGAELTWSALDWAMIPLPVADATTVEIDLTVPDDGRRRVFVARVNTGSAPATRWREPPAGVDL